MTITTNLLPSAKNASDWSDWDLEAFNIQVKTVDALDFFNISELPPSTAPPAVLNSLRKPETCTLMDTLFFFYLSRTTSEGDQSCADLAAFILRMLNYENRDHAIATSARVGFNMYQQFVESAPDLCVIEISRCLLLVEYGKCGPVRARRLQPVLIARAIAAFYYNNVALTGLALNSCSEEETLLGIIMADTTPTFYKIKVTSSLALQIACGLPPEAPTVVERCYPPVNNFYRYLDLGLRDLEYRVAALQCFEALKGLM